MSAPGGAAGPETLLGGRYRLDQRIGAGGMGEVWRATDIVLGRTVAVKTILTALLNEPGFDRRFLVEAQAMAGVSHPGVVAIHDFHSGPDGAFLVMQFVQGETLSQVLGRVGRLSPHATMNLVAQAADALDAVHARGIVHRDIKPANLLMRPDGTVMLTDFGIARRIGSTSLTSSGAVLGTPSYLAPEQVVGEPATIRSDVYALGLVAYECLAGHRPFEGDNPYAVALQRLHQAPRTLVTDASRDVLGVIERALATDPAGRWQTAAEMSAAARASVPGGPSSTGLVRAQPMPATEFQDSGRRQTSPWTSHPAWQPPVAPPRAPTPAGGRRARLAIAALALIVLGGAAVWIATDIGTARGSGTAGVTGPGGGSSTSPAGRARGVPAGFRVCDGGYCPETPTCWGGMTVISGVVSPPERIDCDQLHYWQTFVVAYLPPAAVSVPQEDLMNRPDIAKVCSAAVLAHNSDEPAHVRNWRRDALPLQLPDGTWIVHCVANSRTGETTGSLS